MKVVILAGGYGTRLSEHTKTIPKPMVKIGRHPIIVHIMNHYLGYGFDNFILATGYKSQVFKKYFKNFKKNGKEFSAKIFKKNCKITILDTGLGTLTGGRLKRVYRLIEKKTCAENRSVLYPFIQFEDSDVGYYQFDMGIYELEDIYK